MNMLYQSTIAILLLVGFESVTALGAEAINPEKDIRRGVLLSLIIQGGFCYLFEYFAANFAVGAAHDSLQRRERYGLRRGGVDPAPIGTMLKQTDRRTGARRYPLIVAATVLMALIGTTLACLNTGVRVTYSMARTRRCRASSALLHGNFATPHAGIWILTALSAALGIFGANPHQVDNLTQITLASNTGTFLVYGATCIIAMVAFASRHDRHPSSTIWSRARRGHEHRRADRRHLHRGRPDRVRRRVTRSRRSPLSSGGA